MLAEKDFGVSLNAQAGSEFQWLVTTIIHKIYQSVFLSLRIGNFIFG